MAYSPSSDIPLSAFGAPTANISMNSHKFTSLLDGTVAGDSAGWDQLPTTNQQYAYILTGCVWTADSAGSTLNGSMTAGTVVVAGLVYAVSAVTAHAFTASKDTYVDINIQSGAATVNYTAVSNNQTSPALVSSGTQYNTIRVAMIVTAGSSIAAAGNINQGQLAFNSTTSISTTTVAAGSNGAAFSATPLNVASTTGYPTAGYLVIAHAQTPYMVQYTGTSGGNQFTGVTGVAGQSGGTVSTSDVVTSVLPCVYADSLGNILYPTRPFPSLIGYANFSNAGFTTTSTSGLPVVTPGNSQPGGGLVAPFIVPAGPGTRAVKLIAHLMYVQSSATAGTAITSAIQYGTTSTGSSFAGTTASSAQFKIGVASDGMAVHPEGLAQLAPGSYLAEVTMTQGAAGTLTLGVTYLVTSVYVELV